MAGANPANGANNIARNTAISYQLADNIGVVQAKIHATVAGAVAITNGVFQTGFTGSLTPNGTGYNVVINRTAAFGYSQAVTVGVRAADAQDNQLVTAFSFTTVADATAPTISGRTPAPGASGIARNANVLFTLDDETAVQLTSINVKINGTDAVKNGSGQAGYAFSQSASGNGFACTVNPDTDFAYDQTVQVYIDARDTLGNQLTTSYNFTVKADDVAPWLTDLSPAASATGVNQNATIDLVIRDDSAVVNSSVVVRVNGSVALTNGGFLAPYNGALSSMSSAGGIVTLRLQRTSLFPYRSTNTVQVTARDARLNQLSTGYQFTIRPDNVLPAYKNHSPAKFSTGVANNATFSVDLTDDTAVDAATLSAVIVTNSVTTVVYTNGAFRPGFSGALVPNAENGYTLSFKPAVSLPFSLPVLIRLSAKDGEGNRQDETTWSFTIQAGDATPPTISKLSPYNGQSGVEPDVLVYFETADNVAVRRDSLAVRIDFPDGTTRLALTNGLFQPGFDGPRSSIVSNAWLGFDVRIDHSAPFAFTNSYTVHATARDTSVNDNRVDASWTFAVRPPDTTPPRVSATTPAADARDVPISTLISFVVEDNYAVLSNAISAALNGTTVFTNGAFAPGYAGPGSSLTPNALGGWNVTIDPEKDFSYGETINLRIQMRDTSNNSTVHNITFSLQELPPARAVTNLLDPKNPGGRIRIKVNRTGTAVVRIYNLRGEQVHSLPERFYNVGDEVEWDGMLSESLRPVGSGYYFVRITGSDINTTVRVIVVR
jgi:hypothetical protein